MGIHLDRAQMLLFNQSRPDLAEKELRQELAADPDSGLAHAMLGHAMGQQGQLEAGLTEVKEGVRLAPEMAYGYNILCWLYCKSGESAEAVKAIREAIRLEPNAPDHFQLLSFALSNMGRGQAALMAAEQGLQFNPQHVGCLNRRAVALTMLGRAKEAQTTFDAALALQPTNRLTHTNLGWFHSGRDDLDNAVRSLQESLRLAPNDDYTVDLHLKALRRQLVQRHTFAVFFVWTSALMGSFAAGILDPSHAMLPLGIAAFTMVYLGCVDVPLSASIESAKEVYLFRLERFWRLPLLRREPPLWLGCTVGLLAGLAAQLLWAVMQAVLPALVVLVAGMAIWAKNAAAKVASGAPRKVFIGYTCWVVFIAIAGWVFCAFQPLGPISPFQVGITGLVCHFLGVRNLALCQTMAPAAPHDRASAAGA